MGKVLLTGSTGFVGFSVMTRLRSFPHFEVLPAARSTSHVTPLDIPMVIVGDMDADTDYSAAVVDVDVVVHTAARAHIMRDEVADPLAEYRKVNVDGTLNLARQAASTGVKRLIYISSIKVNGERTQDGSCYRHSDTPAPEDAYGVSKCEAEQGLLEIARATGLEVVIIRPPLVYGPGVKGNFKSLVSIAHKNLPLPLGAVHNKRSLVALDNLVDLIITCIDHPAAAGQTFLVSDDQDVSTTELLKLMTLAAGKKPRLLPVPAGLLRFGATMLGKKAMADRLLGNLQVDITHTKETLGWKPPITLEEGIKRCFE